MSEQIRERGWLLQPAVKGKGKACLCCGVVSDFFDPACRIAVGFGMAALTRDGALVWEEHSGESWDDLMTGQQAEEIAAADPDHDWQITLQGPLSGRTYQRHAPGQWALIEQNQGFA